MRVKTHRIHPAIPKFVPFKLEFTIETREEAVSFHNLFNYRPICDIMIKHGMAGSTIRETIENAVPDIQVEDWGNFVKYFN